ncbi:MAG: signal recognition particle protein [Puniceicoccales bacterium]|jgi:signal recognition particle subunit SRP54|nr:signal recognition particle protein [Puniceicoccales bacterium]
MFESLTRRLGQVFSRLTGHRHLTEKHVIEALEEVEKALLESDVEWHTVQSFVAELRRECVGQDVLRNVTAGQQVIKIVHDRMVERLGGPEVAWPKVPLLKILMTGLHGSGKTTSSVKLARLLQDDGRNPGVVGCDVYRPAAGDQLAFLAQQAGIRCLVDKEKTAEETALAALGWARQNQLDALIFDTAGRLQMEAPLIKELKDLVSRLHPEEVFLVADGALGQQSVNVAKAFHEAVALTGIVLTKCDGDAHGGAAFSMKTAVGVPIRFSGIGEKWEDFERFRPERMAGRILGMGDVVSLVEKAQAQVGEKEMETLQQRMLSKDFNFEDLLSQLRQMKKMGPLSSLSKWLPGIHSPSIPPEKEREMGRFEALILSMTPQERRQPQILTTHRRLRIARGAGMPILELNRLLKYFQDTRKTLQRLKKLKPEQLKKMAGGWGPGPTNGIL